MFLQISVKWWTLWTIDRLAYSCYWSCLMLSSKTWNRKRDLTHNRCLEVECQHQAFSSEERQKERNRPLYSSSAPLHSPMVNTPRDSREWNLWHLLISRSFQEGCREDNEVSWAGSDQRGCRPHQEAVPLVRTKNSKLNEELSKPVQWGCTPVLVSYFKQLWCYSSLYL